MQVRHPFDAAASELVDSAVGGVRDPRPAGGRRLLDRQESATSSTSRDRAAGGG